MKKLKGLVWVSQVVWFVLLANNVCGQAGPPLRIQSLPNGQIQLNWTSPGEFMVERKTSVSPGSLWQALSQNPVRQGDNVSLILPVTGTAEFFRLRPGQGIPLEPTITWIGPNNGLWNNPANWSTGQVPGPADHVLVDIPNSDGKVIFNQGDVSVASLTTLEEFEISGGTLNTGAGWNARRGVILNGGTLRNGTLNLLDGVALRAAFDGNNVLEAMSVNGAIQLGNGYLNVRGGLNLNGVLQLQTGGHVRFQGNQTLAQGTIEFAGDSGTMEIETGTLTLAAGTLVRGKTGNITGANATLINEGKISADVAGGSLRVMPKTFVHDGTAEVLNGAQLSFGGVWNGLGEVAVLNGTFNLDGQFGPVEPLITKAGDGIVRITGTGDLQGSTLTLNAAAGSWILGGGTLRNGTLNLLDGVALRAAFDGNNVLEAMSVNGAIQLGNGYLNVRGGLNLNGVLQLQTGGHVRFQGNQTLAQGTIEFAGDSGTMEIETGTLTLAAGTLVRGKTGNITGANATLINEGKISADVAGGSLRVMPKTFVHDGTAEVLNGAQLSFGGVWNGLGEVAVLNGTFNLDGQFGPVEPLITKAGDGIVRITGTGDLQGSTLTLNAAAGSWILGGGTLRNGTLNLLDGVALRAAFDGNNVLEAMSVNGAIQLGNGYLNVRGGLNLNGVLQLQTGGHVRFQGNQTLAQGTIEFAGDSGTMEIETGTLTLAAGTLVRGKTGNITGANATLINEGKISADVAGGSLRVMPKTFVHDGTAEVLNGAQLSFGGVWNGLGEVAVLNGTFNLDGQFGPVEPLITKAGDGIVRITGTGDLQGSTLTLNAAAGSWILGGGTLRNGTLNLLDGVALRAAFDGNNVLEAMSVNGAIQLGNGYLNVRGGLNLNGVLQLQTGGHVRFQGNQTLAQGTIEFAGDSGTMEIETGTLTLAAGTLVRGKTGNITGANATLINEGKISADVAGGSLRVMPKTFVHDGTAEVLNGAQLSFGGVWNGLGEVAVLNGTFNLDGQFGPVEPLITKAGDGIVRITGTGDLQGSTLTLNAAAGSWILGGGTLRNGTLNLLDGVALRAAFDGNNVLEAMSVNGAIQLGNGYLNVRGGLNLNGVLQLQTGGHVRFQGNQTLAQGTIEFAGDSGTMEIETGTLTLAAGTLVRGKTGNITGANATLINEGKISADVAGGTIQVTVANFTNQGVVEEINGGNLVAPGFP